MPQVGPAWRARIEERVVVDYTQQPPSPLDPADAAWADDLLEAVHA